MEVVPTKNNLETLKTLYIVYAVITLLRSLAVIGYGAFMWIMFDRPEFKTELIREGDLDPTMADGPIKVIIIAIFAVVFIVSLTHSILNFIAANYIGKKRGHTFIFVLGIFNLFSGLLGIGLGVFTIIELTKPQVKEVFGKL